MWSRVTSRSSFTTIILTRAERIGQSGNQTFADNRRYSAFTMKCAARSRSCHSSVSSASASFSDRTATAM